MAAANACFGGGLADSDRRRQEIVAQADRFSANLVPSFFDRCSAANQFRIEADR